MSLHRRNTAWMFEDWPEKTYLRQSQILATTITRLAVVAIHKPLRPIAAALNRALVR